MWNAIFEGKHKSCILAPLCKKYNITDFVYLVNAWQNNNNFFYTESHILQGEEKSKKQFIKDLKKDKTIIKLEQKGNFIITLNKRLAWMSIYMPLWDKRIIQSKPIIQKSDGSEIWEMVCWEKEPLIHILTKLPKEFKIKLKSIEQTKLEDIFLPKLMPKLTEKQRTILELAVKEGYFNFPRKINLDGLAKKLNITKQTAQQHLRIAEKKLVPFLTENIINY
jgi:predicted DNA binding protein